MTLLSSHFSQSFFSVFLCVRAIPSLVCNHGLTFHHRQPPPVCQTPQRGSGWRGVGGGGVKTHSPPQLTFPVFCVLISGDSNHCLLAHFAPVRSKCSGPHIGVIRQLELLQDYTGQWNASHVAHSENRQKLSCFDSIRGIPTTLSWQKMGLMIVATVHHCPI